MAALKGAFVRVEGGLLGSLPNIVIFQFNPETVYRTPTLAWPPMRGTGAGTRDANEQPSEPSESISFSLRVDATDQIAERQALAQSLGILPALSALELLQYPASALAELANGGGEAHRHPPERVPTVLFFWGEQRIVPVSITSLSIFETEYDTALHPIRAEVSVSLEVLTPSQLDPDDEVAIGAYRYTQRSKAALAAVNLVNPVEPLSRTMSEI